jgi:hypothetical protein
MSPQRLPGSSPREPIPISVVARKVALFIDEDTGMLTLKGEGPICNDPTSCRGSERRQQGRGVATGRGNQLARQIGE